MMETNEVIEAISEQEISPIERMIGLYKSIGQLQWEATTRQVTSARVAERASHYYESMLQRGDDLTDDDYRQFGEAKYLEANFRRFQSETNDKLHSVNHELFNLVHGQLLGRLVHVEMIDGSSSIDVIGYSKKNSFTPERVIKGARSEVYGYIMHPPINSDHLEMKLRPKKSARFFRTLSDYLVPVVDSFGKKVLVDIELID